MLNKEMQHNDVARTTECDERCFSLYLDTRIAHLTFLQCTALVICLSNTTPAFSIKEGHEMDDY